jgi:predicted O-methyltransferase YrrM
MPEVTAETLLARGRAFTEARILLTAAELDLFTLLSQQSQTADEVAHALPADQRAITILLDALCGMALLEKRDDRYTCPPAIGPLLRSDSPTTVRPMLLHNASMWQRWSELTGIVRGEAQAAERAHAPRGAASQEAFIGAMHVVNRETATEVARLIQPGTARALLDVGGASGTFTIALLQAAPAMRATLFDLPDVVKLAPPRLAEAGLTERVTLVGGDFYNDPLPTGHDLALLSAIIHQNSHAQNIALYRKVHAALVPGGRLVIRDHVMSPDRTAPPAGAVFAVNMLVGTAGGNTYTLAEYEDALHAAGFERVRRLHDTPTMNALVEAYRDDD